MLATSESFTTISLGDAGLAVRDEQVVVALVVDLEEGELAGHVLGSAVRTVQLEAVST